jgi:hypothetical protein
MILGSAIPGYAWARTIQLGKLRTIFATGSAQTLVVSRGYAQSSCGRFSQLPPRAFARPRCAPQNPVADGSTIPNCHNFNFWQFSAGLRPNPSWGCETPILKDGDAPRGVCVHLQNGNPRAVAPRQQRAPP